MLIERKIHCMQMILNISLYVEDVFLCINGSDDKWMDVEMLDDDWC